MTLDNQDRKNSTLVIKLVSITLIMFGFGFLLVPIYNVFCDITGLNGKTSAGAIAEANLNYQVDSNRLITVEFVASTNEQTPLDFFPIVKKMKIRPGKIYTVEYQAENLTSDHLVAQAIPSVTPGLAAEYFKKIECFCFDEQVFRPSEKKEMPVRFVVNPNLPKRYKTVTLSYTFFDITDTKDNKS